MSAGKPQQVTAQAAQVDMRGEEARRERAAAEARLERFVIAALTGILSADISTPSLTPDQAADLALRCGLSMAAAWERRPR